MTINENSQQDRHVDRDAKIKNETIPACGPPSDAGKVLSKADLQDLSRRLDGISDNQKKNQAQLDEIKKKTTRLKESMDEQMKKKQERKAQLDNLCALMDELVEEAESFRDEVKREVAQREAARRYVYSTIRANDYDYYDEAYHQRQTKRQRPEYSTWGQDESWNYQSATEDIYERPRKLARTVTPPSNNKNAKRR